MKKYYVYIITNNILNKQYVGSHISITNDNYWGSSKYLNEDFKIYGKENFSKEILCDTYENKIDMLNGETENILKHNTLNPNGYNRYLPNTFPGFHREGCLHTEKTKAKIKAKTKESCKDLNKGKSNPMFGKSLYSVWLNKYGEKIANEKQEKRKEKIKISMKGKNKKSQSISHISKRTLTRKGKPHPQKKIKCPYCGHETITTNYNRYHGNNCKFNPLLCTLI